MLEGKLNGVKACVNLPPTDWSTMSETFAREVNVIKTLTDPDIVSFYGSMSTAQYLLWSLTTKQKIKIDFGGAQGLNYLHSQRYTHWDLKLTSLLLDLRRPQPVWKLGDFGVFNLDIPVALGKHGPLPWKAPELLNRRDREVSPK
ncbi:hypothetical protein C5167_006702, partial [Papaver somniferum]